MTHNAQGSAQPKRRRDLDVIGILVVGGLVSLHTAQTFSPIVSYIKNAPSNWEEPSQLVAALFVAFFIQWGMPLMLFIAGMAIGIMHSNSAPWSTSCLPSSPIAGGGSLSSSPQATAL